jgi:hypothetical protein
MCESWGQQIFSVHRHWPALRSRFLHDQDERQHQQEKDHEHEEGVVKGHHSGLSLHHPKDRGISLLGSCNGIGPGGHEGMSHGLNHRTCLSVVKAYVCSKRVEVNLLMAGDESGDAGNADAGADVAE